MASFFKRIKNIFFCSRKEVDLEAANVDEVESLEEFDTDVSDVRVDELETLEEFDTDESDVDELESLREFLIEEAENFV